MAKIELLTHPKWRKLRHLLPTVPEAHVLGHFEMLLHSSYSKNNPDFADAEDLALSAGWSGKPRVLTGALKIAGLVDEVEGGGLRIHDWIDHVPRTIQRRKAVREWAAREGITLPSSADRGGADGHGHGRRADDERTTCRRQADGQRTCSERPLAPHPDPDPDLDQVLSDVASAAARSPQSRGVAKRRKKPRPENKEAQRLLWLFRGAVHKKRGITVGVSISKDTKRVADKLVKARPKVENEAIVLAFAKAPPKKDGEEVTLNVGALCGFAEAAAATEVYRDTLEFLDSDEGRETVEELIEQGRKLGGVLRDTYD